MSEVKVDSIGPRVDNGTLTIGAAGDTVNIAGTAGTGFQHQQLVLQRQLLLQVQWRQLDLVLAQHHLLHFLRGDQTYATAGGANTPNFHAKSSKYKYFK